MSLRGRASKSQLGQRREPDLLDERYAMAEDDPSNPCQVTRKSTRSSRNSFLSSFIKPFGSRLVKPGPATKELSPELRADEAAYKHCNVRQRQVEGIRIYDINSRAVSTAENFIPAYLHDLAPELTPVKSPSSKNGSDPVLTQIQTNEEHDIRSHDFGMQERGHKQRKHIYYFAGGGWQNKASPEHWKFCAHLAATLSSRGFPTTVSIVSYPLAPNYPAAKSFPLLEKLYNAILPPHPSARAMAFGNGRPPSTSSGHSGHQLATTNSGSSGLGHPLSRADSSGSHGLYKIRTLALEPTEEVILAGDSAGGNIALALTIHMLAKDPNNRAPHSLFLVSPAVDLRNTNPDMPLVAKKDPILSMQLVNQTASAWSGDLDPADPRVSPLLGDISILARRQVTVNGVIGGYDVLAPDAVNLRKKCQELRIKGHWLEWEKQMHCFPLAFSYKVFPECNEAVEWILETIQGRKVNDEEVRLIRTTTARHDINVENSPIERESLKSMSMPH